MSREKAFQVVHDAVVELAQESDYPQLMRPDESTLLFGGESGIDSLSLVRLIAEIERSAGQAFGVSVVLADERAMSRRNSPFRTVGALTDLLVDRISDRQA